LRFFTTHNGGATWNEAGIIPTYIDSSWEVSFRIHAYGGDAFAAYLSNASGIDSVVYRTPDNWMSVDSTNPIFFSGITDSTDTVLQFATFFGNRYHHCNGGHMAS
jgi:hypothetical protein